MANLELRPYQALAVDFLKPLEAGLLADEAGLGKTAVAIRSWMYYPVLIISPNSGKYFWQGEIANWSLRPNDKVVVYESWHANSKDFWRQEADVFVIHWEALRFNEVELIHQNWGTIVADEAHRAKNRKSKQSEALRYMSKWAKQRYALTASPFINRPDELWAVLNYLYPKRYKGYWKWFNQHVLAVPKPFGGHEILGIRDREAFTQELKPFTIRRYKKDVLKELPDKIYLPLPVSLYPEQRKVYDELKKSMMATLPDGEVVITPTVLSQMTRMRQVACGLHLIGGPEISSKLDAAVDFIKDSDEPIVVFSQFLGMVHGLGQRLDKAKVPYFLIEGEVAPVTREEYKNRFQAGERQVFIATTQTGGIQITLTRAHTVLFLDQLWSPEYQGQAEDRLHRLGQRDVVRVVILEALNSVEQRVARKLREKGELFGLVFNRHDFEELL